MELTVELPVDAGKVFLKARQALLVKITLKNTGKSPFAISKPPPYGNPAVFKDAHGKLVPEKLRVVSDPAIPLPKHFKILQPGETDSFYFSTEKHRTISQHALKVGTGDTDYELEIGKQYQLELWYSDMTLPDFQDGKKLIPFATAVGAKQWVGEVQTKAVPVEVVNE